MSEVKITDLVSQETIDKIKELNSEMGNALDTYTKTAKDLAKGLEIPVKGIDDLEKLQNLLAQKSKDAATATEQLNRVMADQHQVIANTTPTISKMLMERERLNKTQREEYTEYGKVKSMLENLNGTYSQNLESLIQIKAQMTKNSSAQKENEKLYKEGKLSMNQYIAAQKDLVEQHRGLAVEKSKIESLMKAEEKMNASAETSYVHMSQQLELLKKAYKDLTEEQRQSGEGRELEYAIQDLDNKLKETAADMGEFQRNVGNYAIAGQNGVVTTDSVTAALNQQAVTLQDVADQTKILEEAKTMLDRNDANYQNTLDGINAKLEENKRKLTDVSDIMGKEATTVAEAEAQNKRLSEAIKHIDLTSGDAKKRLEEMRAQIERNNQIIGEATGANEKFADSILSLIGVNINVGSSFETLGSKGNFIEGLNTKTKALAQTLMGLISNPWVLSFLGIAGVVVGFKWWYDYNKGLIEASRLTENFTGATGEAADKVTADMSAMADHMGKGYDETIGAANTLVQQFGISWDEAIGKMKDGIQAGADMSGNMLANIDRFAPALRDAGVSADEFMAILSETRNGIFNEQGIQNIVKAGTRLKAMTPQIEKSLNDVGISAKQMQKDLETGQLSMLDAVQQVAGKLKELPENSQEAGQIMKNVFGRTAAEGGTLLIQSIADVNTNLDKAKENMGDLGRANREQMEAQQELQRTLIAVFKMYGTSFEVMIANAKTFVTQGLTKIIKGCVDVVNWFINMYNESAYLRMRIAAVVAVFKSLWTVAKAAFDLIVNGFKNTGTAIEGVMLILSGEFEAGLNRIKSAFTDGWDKMKNIAINAGKEIGSNFADEFNAASERRLKPVNISLDGESIPGSNQNQTKTPIDPNKKIQSDDDKKKADKEAAKAAKEAEKRAKEELKRINELEEAKINIMAESHEKELLLIRLKFKKKIDEVRGDGETEKSLRLQLAEECAAEVAKCEEKYQKELSKINLENRLASVKEGSDEELTIRLAMLEQKRQEEIKAAEKTGADVSFIDAKYAKEREKLQEDHAKKRMDKIEKEYAEEQSKRDTQLTLDLAALKKSYNKKLNEANGNSKKMEDAEKEYNKKVAAIQRQYAEETAQHTIDMLEKVLDAENLTAEQRIEAERKLAKAKADFEDTIAQNAIDKTKEATDKSTKIIKEWWNEMSDADKINFILDQTAQFLNAFADLASTIFDGQIEKIEEMQEALSESSENEIERITELVEKKVITEEEGEARKRAAEAATAKKQEELEKKKQKLQHKQAVWEKANSLAQAAISTAMGITTTIAQLGMPAAIPMIALTAAMGAIQIATIAAQPIPKYREGTDYHKGGPAIVGDGGRSEVVLFNGGAWLTPDTPTLVDIPKGASVIPDIVDFERSFPLLDDMPTTQDMQIVVSPYNDERLRRGVYELILLIRQQTKQQRAIAARQEYELFKSKI